MGRVRKTWSIQEIWNQKLAGEQRPAKVRDYISASDLGGSFLDRYYKMTGVEPTNLYDERTLRIFDAGKTWEQMMVRMFRIAGILQNTQGWVEIPANDKHLKVIGYYDCVLGGKPDYEQSKKAIEQYIAQFGLKVEEEFIEQRALKLLEYITSEYPDGLHSILAEIKTVNSMAFWAHKNQTKEGYFKGYDHHKLQLLTYLMGGVKDANGELIEAGRLFYISKDDLCLQETGVFMDDKLKQIWLDDVVKMSEYIRNKEVPPKEDDVVWSDEKQSFELNWKLERSPYLTLITGLPKEEWILKATQEMRAKNLELKWQKRAEILQISTKGLTPEAIKKACMAKARELKKLGKSVDDMTTEE